MRKVAVSGVLFHILLASAVSSLAMPPGSGPQSGGGGMSVIDVAAEEKRGDGLVITLEIPRSSKWLAGQTVPGGTSPTVALKVNPNDEKAARLPMAVIDGEPLTVEEFRQALRPFEMAEGEVMTVANQEPAKLLQRLIDTRVIVAEGREIGLDEIPEAQKMIEVFRRQTMREILLDKAIIGVKADPKKTEELYREAILESRIKAVLFTKEADAKAFAGKLKAGGKFDELAAKAVADKKAVVKGGSEGEFVRHRDMTSEWTKAIKTLKKGGVSPVIRGENQFVLIRLLETRSPQSPHAREDARQRALNYARNMALGNLSRNLNQKYVKLDRKLFDGLNFEKELDKLTKDKRVVAEIKGGEAVTVAQVAEELKGRYFHGVERAVEKGAVKKDKVSTLNEIIAKRVFHLEAQAQGIERTAEFKRRVREYEDSVIFGAFLRKVLGPDVKIEMDDLHKYYKEHIEEFTTPEMLGIRRLAFSDDKSAQGALAKLQKGTDFGWLRANAPGQLANDTPGLLEFGDRLVMTKSLPAELRKTLKGVESGKARLYAESGKHYLMYVEKVVPSKAQPFDEVKEGILKKVYELKMQQAIQNWSTKLRKTYPVEIFAKGFNQSAL